MKVRSAARFQRLFASRMSGIGDVPLAAGEKLSYIGMIEQ
jgi:hypothetical protein